MSYVDNICETPVKRRCVITCSPDQGCFSFDNGSTPLEKLVITRTVTPPRSKVSQPVTPLFSTPLSKYAATFQDWESLPSPIPLLKWDREAALPKISPHVPFNLDSCGAIPSVGSEGTVKARVKDVLQNISAIEFIPKPILKTIFPLKEKEGASFSQQAEPDFGYGESTGSFESTLPLQVQVKSKVVVPEKTRAIWEHVINEEEWEKNKRTYVESVKRHMKQQNGVISELDCLMNSIANQDTGRNSRRWQHPSDLTRRNYKNSRAKRPLISLEEWQKRNNLTYQRFAGHFP